jgi:hypothetical protein
MTNHTCKAKHESTDKAGSCSRAELGEMFAFLAAHKIYAPVFNCYKRFTVEMELVTGSIYARSIGSKYDIILKLNLRRSAVGAVHLPH